MAARRQRTSPVRGRVMRIESRSTGDLDTGVGAAQAALAAGDPIVLFDEAENERCYLVLTAARTTPEHVAFMIRYCSGFLTVALPARVCERLDLPAMLPAERTAGAPRFAVTVDVIDGTTTGISARDRCRTVRALADAASAPGDFTRPGHVVPVRVESNSVLVRRGCEEATVDLLRRSDLQPGAVMCELVCEDGNGRLMSSAEAVSFADRHDLCVVTVGQIVDDCLATEARVIRGPRTRVPTVHGTFAAIGYRGIGDGAEHLVMTVGDVASSAPVPTYVHRECLLGDVAGSLGCACRHDLEHALAEISRLRCGIVVYVRAAKTDGPLHTLCEDECIGSRTPVADIEAPAKEGIGRDRAQEIAAQILADLGVQAVCRVLDDTDSTTPAVRADRAAGARVLDRVS